MEERLRESHHKWIEVMQGADLRVVWCSSQRRAE